MLLISGCFALLITSFTQKRPLAGKRLKVRLKTAGKDLSLTLGLIAGPVSANTAAATANTTSTPTDDSIIAQSSVSKEAFATYLNVANFRGLLDVVIGLIPGAQDPAV